MQGEEGPGEDGGRDWRDVSTSQGTMSVAGNHQKLDEAGGTLPQHLQWEHGPADTFNV